MKFKAQDFASEVSNKHAFKIWGKKRSDFFIIVALKLIEKELNNSFNRIKVIASFFTSL